MWVPDQIRIQVSFSNPTKPKINPFDKLFEIFKELITLLGDFDETINWMKELDKEYNLTSKDYTIDDFVEDLKKKGYKTKNWSYRNNRNYAFRQNRTALRKKALNQIFGKIKKTGKGNHKTKKQGLGDEPSGELRNYTFGDALDKISVTESIKNAQLNNGIDHFQLFEKDLVVEESFHKSQMSTVLMVDISHSMIYMVRTDNSKRWRWRLQNSSKQDIQKIVLKLLFLEMMRGL